MSYATQCGNCGWSTDNAPAHAAGGIQLKVYDDGKVIGELTRDFKFPEGLREEDLLVTCSWCGDTRSLDEFREGS